MSQQKWVVVHKVAGEFQAELLRGLLEAQGVQVQLLQEGASRAIGLTFGPLSEVEIYVPETQASDARDVIARFEAGEFEEPATDEPL